MMSNDCIERVDTVFKLEMSSDLTRLIIHFIYKQQTDLNSSQAPIFSGSPTCTGYQEQENSLLTQSGRISKERQQ